MTIVAPEKNVSARIARRLADTLGPRRYQMWFDRSAKLSYHQSERRLDVSVPNRFMADRIGRNFHSILCEAAQCELGHGVDVQLSVDPSHFEPLAATQTDAAPSAAQPRPARPVRRASQGTTAAQLRHQLDDFVVGQSNQLAFAATQRLVDVDDPHARTLFLHGGCGLGKTHLLQGLCRSLLQARPDANVLYTTGEQFTNEFVDAVRANRIDAFRRRIRSLDLLAVDDVHFLANKQATQQEFLHSFDAIGLSGSRLVLASDNHPKLIQQFSEALVSRCVSGVVVQIGQPDLETRVRIIASLAKRRNMVLLDSVAQTLARECKGSVREIEGMLSKLHAVTTMQGGHSHQAPARVGHAMLNQMLSEEMHLTPKRVVRTEEIMEAVVEQLGVMRSQIVGSSRNRHLVLARSLVIYLTRTMTSLSFPEIAVAMNRQNHSTIITAWQRMQKQIQQNVTVTMPVTLEQVPLQELVERLQSAITRN